MTWTAPPLSFQSSQLSTVPKANSSGLGALAGAGRLFEQPADLGSREVGIDEEAGALADDQFKAGLLQLLAERRGAAVLPDDGRRDGLPAPPIPDEAGPRWLVIPMAATSRPLMPAASIASARHRAWSGRSPRDRARPGLAAGSPGGSRDRPWRWADLGRRTRARRTRRSLDPGPGCTRARCRLPPLRLPREYRRACGGGLFWDRSGGGLIGYRVGMGSGAYPADLDRVVSLPAGGQSACSPDSAGRRGPPAKRSTSSPLA